MDYENNKGDTTSSSQNEDSRDLTDSCTYLLCDEKFKDFSFSGQKSTREDIVRDADVCKETSSRKKNKRKDVHRVLRSIGTKRKLVSSKDFPDIQLDTFNFSQIAVPYLFTHEAGDDAYYIVYVPHDNSMCARFCSFERSKGKMLGKGSFGYVYGYNDMAVKMANHSETVISAYVSGLVRHQCGAEPRAMDGVFKNVLVPQFCCIKHGVCLSTMYDSDLYSYAKWDPHNIDNYYNRFCGLADAIRFLNIDCQLSHLDISLTNVLLKCDESLILSAVLSDYSLSEMQPQFNRMCGVFFERDEMVKPLTRNYNKVFDMYHPAFRPLVNQICIIIDDEGDFDGCEDPKRYCNLELCALSFVCLYSLIRMLNKDGVSDTKRNYENDVFDAANAVCRLSAAHEREFYIIRTAETLAYQLWHMRLLFEECAVKQYNVVCNVCDIEGKRRIKDKFTRAYGRRNVDELRQKIQANYDVVTMYQGGQSLIKDLEQAFSIMTLADLDGDHRQLFVREDGVK